MSLTCANWPPSADQTGCDYTKLHANTPGSLHNSGVSRELARPLAFLGARPFSAARAVPGRRKRSLFNRRDGRPAECCSTSGLQTMSSRENEPTTFSLR